MSLTDPKTWEAQWEAFLKAPFLITPLLIAVAIATFWITRQFTTAQVEALRTASAASTENAKVQSDVAKAQIENAKVLAEQQMAVLQQRMQFSDERETALQKQIAELREQMSKSALPSEVTAEGHKLDRVWADFQGASDGATQTVGKTVDIIQSVFGAALRAVGG